MSYILDALRRADSERERGSVPGIHAQQVPVVSPERDAAGRAPTWAWMAGGAVLLLLGALTWHVASRDEPAREVAATPAPSPMPAPPPVAAQVSPPISPPAIAAPPPRGPVPAQSRPAAAVPPAAAPVIAATAPPAKRAAPASAPASAAEARIYAQHELPETIRRELPKLAIGGSIYSDSAASRFLIINGRIFHENDKVAPDLLLEQIKLKSAVLRYKGYRYGITY